MLGPHADAHLSGIADKTIGGDGLSLDDVVALVRYLSLPAGRMIHGTVVTIDGERASTPDRDTPFADTARFAPSDPDAIVSATFVCPLCLRNLSVEIVVEPERDALALCRCFRCAVRTTIALTAEQTLRLTLAPPPDLRLVFVG